MPPRRRVGWHQWWPPPRTTTLETLLAGIAEHGDHVLLILHPHHQIRKPLWEELIPEVALHHREIVRITGLGHITPAVLLQRREIHHG
jgi:hypothetical protein